MIKRAISGAVFLAIMLAAILWDENSFFLLFMFISLAGCFEWVKAIEPNARLSRRLAQLSVAWLWYMAIFNWLSPQGNPLLSFPLFIIPILAMMVKMIFDKSEDVIANYGASVLGFVWIFSGIIGIYYLAFHFQARSCFNPYTYSGEVLLGVMVFIWVHDTFAYLTGRAFGKHPLLPSVSPKKTKEGAIGGIIAAVVAAFIWSIFFESKPSFIWLILGFTSAIAANLGDLFESRLKRALGIKDLGTLIPGHGGVLDRFDALFFAAPFAVLVLLLIEIVGSSI